MRRRRPSVTTAKALLARDSARKRRWWAANAARLNAKRRAQQAQLRKLAKEPDDNT